MLRPLGFSLIALMTCLHNPVSTYAEENTPPPAESSKPFTSFTGRVTHNKVRMRMEPNLEGTILRELDKGDLFVIIGETEDYYTIACPNDLKAYVYRPYVLDGQIEGHRVNIRLEPHTEAPVLAQLNSGDKVFGQISEENNKWLKISPPEEVTFYVYKDYIANVGGPEMIVALEARQFEVNELLNSTYLQSQRELQRPFEEIDLTAAYENFGKVINNYSDFADHVTRAKELLTLTQETYLQKKIEFLEAKAQYKSGTPSPNISLIPMTQPVASLEEKVKNFKEKPQTFVEVEPTLTQKKWNWEDKSSPFENLAGAWAPVEQSMFHEWTQDNPGATPEEFYQHEWQQAVTLRGIVEPYTRAVKNKPGDYLLVSEVDHHPIAYLYSTEVNLHEYIGQPITIKGTSRPNNHFAYPAYFALYIE